MASGRFVRAHDLRRAPGAVLKNVNNSGEPCYITEKGKAKAVLMDINRYNALMDLLEDTEAPVEHHVGDETRRHVSVQGIIEQAGPRRVPRHRHA
jgi:prevent-host-death family protein